MFESGRIKGLIFDCYKTLIDIDTDEDDERTYEMLSVWLRYNGVKIKPEVLRDEYKKRILEKMDVSGEEYPEVKVEEIFSDICYDYKLWTIDEEMVGIAAARVFRASSIRRFEVYPESVKLLEMCTHISKKCIISNGQRVFSEIELRYLGLYDEFDFVMFSSDFGYKKPDKRLFMTALNKFGLEPGEVLSIGDTFENDIIPPREIGMEALEIEEAWKFCDIFT
ncbi:HAD family hydrolase [Methanohalophilus halophilus]|uniref:HAD family hydrolase n=1 Tax=Methanohalophilus halophilus TaxID=2177 RepID=A0A1L3Q4H1_9EURY|nr:HAD family hydrolase [Methanohalophilus halophilus]APH39723.1 HAD family hydrolase [Methanohalophilus halophilus]RNI08939.1 HAD family hydrolase [Methanohalophilus halophilus]SDW37474.1 putative hydrolase of the HAD superfamily [Methanohalophilus halophilus]